LDTLICGSFADSLQFRTALAFWQLVDAWTGTPVVAVAIVLNPATPLRFSNDAAKTLHRADDPASRDAWTGTQVAAHALTPNPAAPMRFRGAAAEPLHCADDPARAGSQCACPRS